MTRQQRKKLRRAKRYILFYGSRLLILAILIFAGIGIYHMFKCGGKVNAETPEKPINTKAESTYTQKAVELTTQEAKTEVQITEKAHNYSMDWDSEESYLLAKIAMAEAEGESLEGKAMVIRVVLNRVNDPNFPNTIKEVIYEKGQFAPVREERWETIEPNNDCWAALELVRMAGWDESEGATYFEATWNTNDWHKNHLEYIKTVGNQNFYREKVEE